MCFQSPEARLGSSLGDMLPCSVGCSFFSHLATLLLFTLISEKQNKKSLDTSDRFYVCRVSLISSHYIQLKYIYFYNVYVHSYIRFRVYTPVLIKFKM